MTTPTEPSTEAGLRLHALEHQRIGEPAEGETYCEELAAILAIEAEARATPPALPFTVLRLAEAIDDHNLWMGGLEDHGEGVGCSTDCAGDIYARLTNREAPPDA